MARVFVVAATLPGVIMGSGSDGLWASAYRHVARQMILVVLMVTMGQLYSSDF